MKTSPGFTYYEEIIYYDVSFNYKNYKLFLQHYILHFFGFSVLRRLLHFLATAGLTVYGFFLLFVWLFVSKGLSIYLAKH